MRAILLILIHFICFSSFAQSSLYGIVEDKGGNPVFAANVYLKGNPQKGVISGFNGIFVLQISDINDTLIISFIGFQTKKIPLISIDTNKQLVVILKEDSQTLTEIIITAQDPISEQFPVVKMNKMDIYLNPVSQADPLKAITVLPASTTTNESANPSLRGSSADRTRVVLNGVPIYNPVRAGQIVNNQGFFSLFNPEIIDNLYVYASNPPLTYGNTSAGLVEIQTNKSLEANQLQLSASLASIGLFISQKTKKDISFVQAYGNLQFSDAYVGIQKENLPQIENFQTKDAGINFRTKIGKRAVFNSYNYFINESFLGNIEIFTYKGEVITGNKRFFTVNNLNIYTNKGALSINSGVNTAKRNFSFGNTKSENRINEVYTSLNYKWFASENTHLQFGISHDYHQSIFNDSIPVYYYALAPNSPSFASDTNIFNHSLEAYFYTKWDMNDKWVFSSGMRSNIPVNNQKYYLNWQLGLKYTVNRKQHFLLSGGRYHNYSTPNFYSEKFNLLSSYQIALDYTYKLKNTLLKAATYFKNEKGEQTAMLFFTMDNINTYGIELFLEQDFYNYFKFIFSNSHIKQIIKIDNKEYKGQKDFNYLIKATLQFNNPKLFSLALTFIVRPGTYYTPIVNSSFDHETGFYEPEFSNDLFNTQYGNYNRFDISLSRYFRINSNAIIVFISLNNVLNSKNEHEVLYNTDYSELYFGFYQLRAFYFGMVWQLNY